MNKTSQRILVSVLWAALVSASALVLEYFRILPEAPDRISYDWRVALFSDRVPFQRPDIALVLINENSLGKYWARSPVDRGLLAELVRGIDMAGAKTIGLDFIFDRPSEPKRDLALLKAINDSKTPIIMGETDLREVNVNSAGLEWQKEFLKKTNRPISSLFFAKKNEEITLDDDVVRSMMELKTNTNELRPFAWVLAASDGPRSRPTSEVIDWLLPPDKKGTEVFATLQVPEHTPVDGEGDGSTVLPNSLRRLLKDKIVIVGGDFVDRDQHRIPLSIETRKPVPGAFIHAQIAAQIRDNRSVRVFTQLQNAACVFLVALASFHLSWRFKLVRIQAIVQTALPVFLIALGAFLFAEWKVVVSASAIIVGWLGGAFGGSLYEQAKSKLKKWAKARRR